MSTPEPLAEIEVTTIGAYLRADLREIAMIPVDIDNPTDVRETLVDVEAVLLALREAIPEALAEVRKLIAEIDETGAAA